jgi:multisubunit Na+/H+ antiporter MnhC subunit
MESEQTTAPKSYEGIGGWLILVAFILLRAPIAVLVTLFRAVFPLLQHDTWAALTTKGTESYHPLWAPLVISELIVNLAFLALALVVLVLFFRRKRSFPRFVIILYLAHFIWEVCLALVLRQIPAMAGEPATSSLVGAIGLALGCAIWIPYFLISKRVRATFTR